MSTEPKEKQPKEKQKILIALMVLLIINAIGIAGFLIYRGIDKRINALEEKAFHPVVVERCEEYSDERTYDLVQQAFDCEELESYKWFDYAYTVHFGKNDYGQDLIFVTFYYSKVNDPNDYKVTVCNYYVSPDVNKWEIVE